MYAGSLEVFASYRWPKKLNSFQATLGNREGGSQNTLLCREQEMGKLTSKGFIISTSIFFIGNRSFRPCYCSPLFSSDIIASSLLFFFQDSGTSSVNASLRNAKNEDLCFSHVTHATSLKVRCNNLLVWVTLLQQSQDYSVASPKDCLFRLYRCFLSQL